MIGTVEISPLAIATLLAMLLNLIIPDNKDESIPTDRTIDAMLLM